MCVWFVVAGHFYERLCDGTGAAMNERERMVDVWLFEIVCGRVGVD